MAVLDQAGASDEVTSNAERILIGALGGLSAVLVKFIGKSQAEIAHWFHSNDAAPLNSILGEYYFLAPILIILGAIIGGITNERSRLKLYALGISAPALIASYQATAPGSYGREKSQKPPVQGTFLEPSSAWAEESTEQDLAQGISSFFSGGDRNYTVRVGTFEREKDADDLVQTVNDNSRSVQAFTREFKRDNAASKYRVYLTQMFTLSEASGLRDQLVKSKLFSDPVIAPVLETLPEGWVAVTLPVSDNALWTLTSGQAIKPPLGPNTMIKALTSVYLRPGPATWGRNVGIVNVGECFQVQETRSLPTKDKPQIWARGNLARCG